jgi:penicillin amidase
LTCGIAALALLTTVYCVWRASLPPLDGRIESSSLVKPVSIERDALGIPTIVAANRVDLAFGTGLVHGQDRFFQMDLSRRLAAGELTPLFGDAAQGQDAQARIFGFRKVARQVLAQATPWQRSILDAYARGVNAGLASLQSRPWEYWVLRSDPKTWKPEDTFLVVYAMWWDLQYAGLQREALRSQIVKRLGPAACLLYPNRSEWDAPNESGSKDGAESCQPPAGGLAGDFAASILMRQNNAGAARSDAGSNNWAVAGRLTASGGALVANDMHLSLRVPAIWYRARLRTGDIDLNGVTLPGAPVLVAGSNGHIAWGFTNSYGTWLDIEHGAPRWLATVPEATNLNLMDLETVTSVERALALAPQIGIPQQNLVIGDRAGHIAWTLAGRIPQALGARRADGPPFLSAAEYPRIVDPALGRIWTANARATSDPRQELAIGGDKAALGAEYDLGARAKQIRNDLLALRHPATPADMLATQLDDRAIFLQRWRDLALRSLDAAALENRPDRAEFKRLIAGWNARASIDSVGYRLVRNFRSHTEAVVWQSFLRELAIPTTAPVPPRFEVPLWNYAAARPQLLLAQIDAALAEDTKACGSLSRCTWGKRSPVRIRHPLSRALPFFAPLLDMPSLELPGDHDMPRVQDGAFGASERFAVTPGLESQGYLHIAGGQSGHPLSPYYRAGFKEWAQGKPLPFLPGKSQHRLTLQPR